MNDRRWQRLDHALLGAWAFLAAWGLLAIFSASSLEADQSHGNSLRFVIRQSAGVGIGALLGSALMFVPMKWIRACVWPFYVLIVLAQGLILTPLAHSANGATRWFRVGPVNVQPSELMKLALVLALAHYLTNNRGKMKDPIVVFGSVLLVVVPLVAMLPQSDTGSLIILLGLSGVAMFLAGLQWRWVIGLGTAAVILLTGWILLEPYRVTRLTSFLDPFKDASDSGYQVVQGWIAMATGGLTGTGIGNGVAQRGFLPEPHTDFISAVVVKETGARGWIVLVLAYGFLLFRGFSIADRCKTLFPLFVVTGFTCLLAAQVVINLGVVGGLLPNKGLVLPFLSYGASAVMTHTLVVAFLLRMSMEADAVSPQAPWRTWIDSFRQPAPQS